MNVKSSGVVRPGGKGVNRRLTEVVARNGGCILVCFLQKAKPETDT